MFNNQTKLNHLKQLSDYRRSIIGSPPLRNLFLELTLRCNENCIHCGSRCNDVVSEELSLNQYKDILEREYTTMIRINIKMEYLENCSI